MLCGDFNMVQPRRHVQQLAQMPDKVDTVLDTMEPVRELARSLAGAKAVLFLLGSVVDYEVSPMHSKFTFRNPNQTDACGCGESVTIVPAQAAE